MKTNKYLLRASQGKGFNIITSLLPDTQYKKCCVQKTAGCVAYTFLTASFQICIVCATSHRTPTEESTRRKKSPVKMTSTGGVEMTGILINGPRLEHLAVVSKYESLSLHSPARFITVYLIRIHSIAVTLLSSRCTVLPISSSSVQQQIITE